MLLSVDALSKRFPGSPTPVLDDVSFSLSSGEAVALTGESGSGKSTLLHIVAGLEPLDSGEITIGDAKLSKLDDKGRSELRRNRIGLVFQQFNLIPSLTVAQNLSFQARLAKQDPATDELENMVTVLGLQDHLAKYPEELSGGQQQRVAIGRALLHRPDLVLADEPTGNLDENTADAVFDLLLDQCRAFGTGLLLVTHSERLAAKSDRRLHLSHGTRT